jgi:hypothetical protein
MLNILFSSVEPMKSTYSISCSLLYTRERMWKFTGRPANTIGSSMKIQIEIY